MTQTSARIGSLTDLLAEAAPHVETLDPEQLAVEAERPDTAVVDVRELDERRANGSIRGSVHVPRGQLELRADPADSQHQVELSPDRRVVVYCSDGRRSLLAAWSLMGLGYRDVAHLAGGIAAWDCASLPLEGAIAVMTPEEYEALSNPRPPVA